MIRNVVDVMLAAMLMTVPAAQAKPAARIQAVRVSVSATGFTPSTITLRKGVPARVTFTRRSAQSCATEVVLPAFHLRKALPLNKPVTVAFTPVRGGVYAFSCGMNMLHGKIVVK